MTIGRTMRAGVAGAAGLALLVLAGCTGEAYPPAARGTSVYDPDTAGEIYEEGYEQGARDGRYDDRYGYGVRRTEGGYRCNPGLIFDC